MAYNQIIPG